MKIFFDGGPGQEDTSPVSRAFGDIEAILWRKRPKRYYGLSAQDYCWIRPLSGLTVEPSSMDFSSELLKMIEARSHPRFVKLVVWCAGLGIISGALLLVGELGIALAHALKSGFVWASTLIAGTSSWAATIAFLKGIAPFVIGAGFVLGAKELLERWFFGPGIENSQILVNVQLSLITKSINNLSHAYTVLRENLAAAEAKGVDVSEIRAVVSAEHGRIGGEYIEKIKKLGLLPPEENATSKDSQSP